MPSRSSRSELPWPGNSGDLFRNRGGVSPTLDPRELKPSRAHASMRDGRPEGYVSMDNGENDRKLRGARPNRIWSDDEIHALARSLHDVLPQPIVDRLRLSGLDAEEHLRFMPVARSLIKRRKAASLDIKTVARQLKVPQYRLRDIESGNVSRIVPDMLIAYIEHMQLTGWFARWKETNAELAGRIGLQD